MSTNVLKLVQGFASKDYSKTILTRVNLKGEHLEATDGYKLIRFQPSEPQQGIEPIHGYPNCERIIPRKLAETWLSHSEAKALIKSLKAELAVIRADMKRQAIVFNPTARLTVNTINVSFIGYKIIVKSMAYAKHKLDKPYTYTDRYGCKNKKTHESLDMGQSRELPNLMGSDGNYFLDGMTFNVFYLLQCLEAMVALSPKVDPIYISRGTDVQPIVLTDTRYTDQGRIQILLMPIKP